MKADDISVPEDRKQPAEDNSLLLHLKESKAQVCSLKNVFI